VNGIFILLVRCNKIVCSGLQMKKQTANANGKKAEEKSF
jgi:hypothetical protein